MREGYAWGRLVAVWASERLAADCLHSLFVAPSVAILNKRGVWSPTIEGCSCSFRGVFSAGEPPPLARFLRSSSLNVCRPGCLPSQLLLLFMHTSRNFFSLLFCNEFYA